MCEEFGTAIAKMDSTAHLNHFSTVISWLYPQSSPFWRHTPLPPNPGPPQLQRHTYTPPNYASVGTALSSVCMRLVSYTQTLFKEVWPVVGQRKLRKTGKRHNTIAQVLQGPNPISLHRLRCRKGGLTEISIVCQTDCLLLLFHLLLAPFCASYHVTV